MAGEQSKSSPPGAFPDDEPSEDKEQSYGVAPIPASGGIGNPLQLTPGDKVPEPSTINDNTVQSTAHDDEELKSKDQDEQTVGVAPIPATGGIGNPLQLTPGDKVPDPSTLTGNTVESTVTTDKESYENASANAPVTPAREPTLQYGRPPATGTMIPESSLPMGEGTSDVNKENIGPTINSTGPSSTTAALAGQQPIEQRGVPEVVKESQQEAGQEPEASANAEAVEEKKEMEDQLRSEVSEVKPTSESGMLGSSSSEQDGGISGKAAAGVAAGGVAAAGGAYAVNELVKEKTGKDPASALPESTQESINKNAAESSVPEKAGVEEPAKETTTTTEEPAQETNTAAEPAKDTTTTTEESAKETTTTSEAPKADVEDHTRETTTTVPQEVTDSQKEAGLDAEAAANPEAVKEKSQMEDELLSKVQSVEAGGEPAPTASAATTETAPQATTTTTTTTSASGAPQLGEPSGVGLAPISMGDGSRPQSTGDDERESRPEESKPTTATEGLNAPADAPAKTSSAEKVNELAKKATEIQHDRDISPKSPGPEEPQVTTGIAESSMPAKNGPSDSKSKKRQSFVDVFKSSDSPSQASQNTSSTAATDKKDKKRSLFGRIKDKLKQ